MTIVDVGLVVGVIAMGLCVRSMVRNCEPRPRWNLLSVAVIAAVIAYVPAAMLAGGIEDGYFEGRRGGRVWKGRDPFMYWTFVLILYAGTITFLSLSLSLLVRMFRKGSGPEELV